MKAKAYAVVGLITVSVISMITTAAVVSVRISLKPSKEDVNTDIVLTVTR